ncbi:ArsR family transcriptional regulator, partial [Escherichia coli]|nr:ArsR family transcriptional regulator [Escherichia coli]
MPSDKLVQSRARALSSPLRLRILRLCLHESRTNKEIADILDLNPATSLHHVRTLVSNGYLAAEEPRRGNRGAKEVPYRSTKQSWG